MSADKHQDPVNSTATQVPSSSLSTCRSVTPPSSSQVESEEDRSEQQDSATTPTDDLSNEHPQDSVRSSPTSEGTLVLEYGPREHSEDPNETESYASSSSLSSAESESEDDEDAEAEPAAASTPKTPPEGQSIVFEPYFRRSGFIPAPEITGNEAWAMNKVWNHDKRRYDTIDLWKIAKY